MEDQILFKTKTGLAFTGLKVEAYRSIWQELQSSYGLTMPQICEAASYSMAMVLRYALGLSALGGRVYAVVDDTPSGWIALATLRHMVTAGAEGGVILIPAPDKCSPDIELQAAPLMKMGIEFIPLQMLLESNQTADLIASCHNLICGVFNTAAPSVSDQLSKLLEIMNEAQTPIHAIEVPPGLDADTGTASANALFASSTLSLGAPLIGLHKGQDYVGRHYLCDISIAADLYRTQGPDLTQLFAEQPVIQIFPA